MLPYSLNKQGIASLATLISTFVLIAGLVAGVILTQKQQELREKAAPQPCYVCLGIKECKKVADPPYCNTGDNECFVDENCKPTPTPKPTNTPIPIPCIADGKCTGPGDLCCGRKDYFDLTCPVTETRCGIKPTSTPTPTPVTCTVKYENRGCGRSSCVETAMWQLVTNSDCSITSRCVPNYPQCIPTPTPMPTPTLYCSDYLYDQCLYGCEPTSSGGKCKPKPTPTLYCSTNNLLRCLYGCKPDSYGGRCKSQPTPTPTPYCSDYLYDQCLYGCEPTSGGGKCKPPKCEDLKTVEQCNTLQLFIRGSPSCAWYHCSTRCLPVGTDLVSAGCAEPCPPLPGATGVSETCSFIGQTCERRTRYLQGKLYICQDGTWQEYGELKIIFDNNCSDEEKNKYREKIGNLPLELHTNETIEISCPDEGEKTTVIVDNTEIEVIFCGALIRDTITLSCNAPACQPAGYYNCQYVVNHEFAHHQARSTSLSSHDIESFNRAIGCRSNGKGDFTFEEEPVTGYGRSNCAEAYAELIAQYVYDPCNVANNPDWSRQYEWLLTNPDSPFQGKELCEEAKG